MSWMCEVHAEGEWVSNSLRFATEKEANDYGWDLRSRWYVPDNHRATESDEPVNYRWNGSSLEAVEDDKQ